ncbi:hypothetical protein JT358_16870 [Micrococcales bacterium 31B]|nr:hypothetical protein [Micrococcales bacterium 31B]
MSKKFIALTSAALVAASLGLAGCSSSQSVAEACAQLKSSFESNAALKAPTGDAAADPEALKKTMEDGLSALKKESDSLGNEEVKTAVNDMITSMDGLPDLMASGMSDPSQLAAITEKSTQIQAASKKVTDLCPDLSAA